MMKAIYTFILFVVITTQSEAKRIRLFEGIEYTPVKYHSSAAMSPIENSKDELQERISELAPGDEIEFSNGKIYTLVKKLGAGHSNVIYSILENPLAVIRLPLSSQKMRSISDTIVGDEFLPLAKDERVQILDSNPKEYVVVDKISEDAISLSEMIEGVRAQTKQVISEQMRSELKTALFKFFSSAKSYEQIGDFHYDQIRYDVAKKKWILLDWGGYSQKIQFSYQVDSEELVQGFLILLLHHYNDLKNRKSMQATYDLQKELVTMVHKSRQKMCLLLFESAF